MHKYFSIIFTQSHEPIIVSKSDYDALSKNKWFIETSGYAVREEMKNGKRKIIKMHRQIMGNPDGMVVDHINGDKLDNTRENLRVCTLKQNFANSRPPSIKGKSSKYKGVSFCKRDKLWRARFIKNGKAELKYSKFEHQAARNYDLMAIKANGQYAWTNFPKSNYAEHDIEVAREN